MTPWVLPNVFETGVWPELRTIMGPELRDLAESLPSLVLHSKASSTVKRYSGAFSRWKKWVGSKPGLGIFPAGAILSCSVLEFPDQEY